MSSRDRETLPVVRAADLEEPDPARRWLIEPLWIHGGVGTIGGLPKSCKKLAGLGCGRIGGQRHALSGHLSRAGPGRRAALHGRRCGTAGESPTPRPLSPSRSCSEHLAHRRHYRTHGTLGSAVRSASPRRDRAPPLTPLARPGPLCPPASGERKPGGRGLHDPPLLACLAAHLQPGGYCHPPCPPERLGYRWFAPARVGRFLCPG